MEFRHASTEYRVTKCLNSPVYLFYALKGNHASYLFSTQISGRVTVKTCVQELIDRANQRRSAIENTFHLTPRERIGMAPYLGRNHQPSIISGGAQ